METLIDFSEDEKRYLLYHSRLDALCKEKTLDDQMKELHEQLGRAQEERRIAQEEQKIAWKKMEDERRRREKLETEKEQTQKKYEAILQQLREKGIDPDAL